MSRRSLQNDNNAEKNKKKRKSGFFDDPGNDLEQDVETAESVNTASAQSVESALESDAVAKDQKRFLLVSVIFLSVLAVLFVSVKIISGLDFISESDYSHDGLVIGAPEIGHETKLYIGKPDWETDIFTLDEYLYLEPEKMWYKEGAENVRIHQSEAYQTGGAGLYFLTSYFDAVKKADIATLNSMYTENYFKIGKYEKHEAFPQQKIFDIQIQRRFDIPVDEKEEKIYDVYYYLVSYKIYENDGMFRDDIDEYSSRPQVIKVIIDSSGVGKIDMIWWLSGGYTG